MLRLAPRPTPRWGPRPASAPTSTIIAMKWVTVVCSFPGIRPTCYKEVKVIFIYSWLLHITFCDNFTHWRILVTATCRAMYSTQCVSPHHVEWLHQNHWKLAHSNWWWEQSIQWSTNFHLYYRDRHVLENVLGNVINTSNSKHISINVQILMVQLILDTSSDLSKKDSDYHNCFLFKCL